MDDIIKVYSLTPPGLMRRGMQVEYNHNNDFPVNINGDMPIGMAYVPWQTWQGIYDKDKALVRGTVFSELDKPFKGAKR